MRFTSTTAALVLLVAVSACSSQGGEVTTTSPDATTTTIGGPDGPTDPNGSLVDVDLTAGCGPVALPTPVVELPDEALDDDARAALDRVVEVVGGEAGFFAGYDWFIAEKSDRELVLFGQSVGPVGPGDPPYASAVFEFRDGIWEPAGWGQCRIEVDAPGFGNAFWVLDGEPRPGSTELLVQINERNCASGQPPVGRAIVPVITADAERVTITVLVEPVAGGAACPTNPWFPYVIDLGEALGDRVLYDGAVVPALERPWPATRSSIDSLGAEE